LDCAYRVALFDL
jgi:hypothetical protein